MTILRTVFLATLLLSVLHGESQTVVINEFLSSNKDNITDADGDHEDWIELYNTTDASIDLGNYSLSDDEQDLDKWRFPTVQLPAHGLLLLFASGKDRYGIAQLHLNFKIAQAGEDLFLSNASDSIINIMNAVALPSDDSYGCIPDGSLAYARFGHPTPNAGNAGSDGILCSHPSGFYAEEFLLSLNAANDDVAIHYTHNGAIPTTDDPLYTAPLSIGKRTTSLNDLSLIPTTPLSGPDQLFDYIWGPPAPGQRAGIIRYAGFKNGHRNTDIFTRTYFVGHDLKAHYTFPVVSVVTDSLNLFDHDTGIYIPGRRFDENGFAWWPEGNYNNRGREYERNVHISYFENNGTLGFETDAGIRMRGKGSASFPQKSFSIFFRNEYGLSTLDHPIFEGSDPNVHKRLIFRNSGNDFPQSHFKDAFLQDLLRPTGLELQTSRASVVFLNGEYWGIHNIREKYDRHYFKYKYGIDEGNINILSVCGMLEEGDATAYFELIHFVDQNDLSENEAYEWAGNRMDIDNFIDYQIAEIYFANYDWPCNNYKMWKTDDDSSKWRFLLYDLDLAFGAGDSDHDYPSLEHATSDAVTWPHCPCSNTLFRNLLENDVFRDRFVARFEHHLNTTFHVSNVVARIDSFETLFFPEIEEHIHRWNYPTGGPKWVEEIGALRDFARKRPCYIREHIMDFFHLNDLDFECDPLPSEVNGLNIYPNPNNGQTLTVESTENGLLSGPYRIISYTGQTVQIGEAFDYRLKIDLSQLTSGLYIIRFDDEMNNYLGKFMVTK